MSRRNSLSPTGTRRGSGSPSPAASPKSQSGGVKVMVRVRPFNSREKGLSEEKGEPLRCIVEMTGNQCIVLDQDNDYEPNEKYQAFVFDHCLWSLPEDQHNPMSSNGFADQSTVYEKGGAEALTNAWEGYNTCIFAYGQTGAGKSFSMLGAPGLPGIAPQIITNLFQHITKQAEDNPQMLITVEVTFFEIYMEKVKDLFNKGKKDSEYSEVKIRQHPLYGIQVQGLETKQVKTEAECASEMDYGVSQRSLASTKMNATSSRSHAIFQIHINQNNVNTKDKTQATINLVDLAGSERIGKTGATGATKDEGMAINLSLSTLRKVMDALVDLSKGKKTNPPYRESMLTWVLKESLGGNSKTVMITAISPHYDNIDDTVSTLRYGLKAKAIVNKAVKQATTGKKLEAQMRAQIAELEMQLKQAREAGGGGAGGGGLSEQEIEEQLAVHHEAMSQVEQEKKIIEEREHELKFLLDNQRKQNFAQAFRAAFRVTEGKHKEKTLVDDMQKMAEERRQLEEAHAKQLRVASDKEKELQESVEKTQAEVQNDRRDLLRELGGPLTIGDVSMSSLKEQIATLKSKATAAESDSKGLSEKLVAQKSAHDEAMQQAKRSADELLVQSRRQVEDAKAQAQAAVQEALQQAAAERAQQEEVFREAAERTAREAERFREMSEVKMQEALQDRVELETELQDFRRKYELLAGQLQTLQLQHEHDKQQFTEELSEERQRCEQALLWSAQRKEHYKELAAHLKEVHDADTRIIESLGREACHTYTEQARVDVGVDMASSPTELRDRAMAAEAQLSGKRSALQTLGSALADYQDAATTWVAPATHAAGQKPDRGHRSPSPRQRSGDRYSPLTSPSGRGYPRISPDVWQLPPAAMSRSRERSTGRSTSTSRRRGRSSGASKSLFKQWADSPYGLSPVSGTRRRMSPHAAASGAAMRQYGPSRDRGMFIELV